MNKIGKHSVGRYKRAFLAAVAVMGMSLIPLTDGHAARIYVSNPNFLDFCRVGYNAIVECATHINPAAGGTCSWGWNEKEGYWIMLCY